jgi:hypothetical protein
MKNAACFSIGLALGLAIGSAAVVCVLAGCEVGKCLKSCSVRNR